MKPCRTLKTKDPVADQPMLSLTAREVAIAALHWATGRDTKDIAEALKTREATVVDSMPLIRERCKDAAFLSYHLKRGAIR